VGKRDEGVEACFVALSTDEVEMSGRSTAKHLSCDCWIDCSATEMDSKLSESYIILPFARESSVVMEVWI
jgi:hypothetical protein